MTAAQWKQVESQLSPWGQVKLRVDGYNLVLKVQQKKPLHFVILPYVNGYSRSVWWQRNEAGVWCEEARRFLPLIRRRLFGRAALKRAGKQAGRAGKRMIDELRRDTLESRGWYWSSFAALKRHLIAHNQSIELAEETP